MSDALFLGIIKHSYGAIVSTTEPATEPPTADEPPDVEPGEALDRADRDHDPPPAPIDPHTTPIASNAPPTDWGAAPTRSDESVRAERAWRFSGHLGGRAAA